MEATEDLGVPEEPVETEVAVEMVLVAVVHQAE